MFTETVASVDALRGCIRRPLAAVSLRRRVNPMVVTVLIVPMRQLLQQPSGKIVARGVPKKKPGPKPGSLASTRRRDDDLDRRRP
jgi:hypothetical protein